MEETEELQLQGVKGRRMSNYGVKTYTPEQIKEQWRESMRVMWNTNNSILIEAADFFSNFKIRLHGI